jgi:hypothetical protein
MKKYFRFVLMALLTWVFTTATYAQNVIDLQNVTTNTTFHNGDVLTGTLTHHVKLSIANGATVTLRDVTINGAYSSQQDPSSNGLLYEWAGITCDGDATIILEGTNKVKGFNSYYPGILPGKGLSTLVIQGSGSLEASSNGDATGIGSGLSDNPIVRNLNCGNIVIKSGTITAIGGEAAAGIGSSTLSSCGNITIMGGTVTAKGGLNGAGIGTGWTTHTNSSCGNITITGGTVTAIGGEDSAGIGSGPGGMCDDVTISGGTVNATGNGEAAGIGCGVDAYVGIITISGGTVFAKGGNNGAGIGMGVESYTQTIEITGGTVTAIKGDQASYSIWAKGNNDALTIGDKEIEEEYIDKSPYTISFLDEKADNTEAWNAIGKTPDAYSYISLKRTMKAGSYHTLALPFGISKEKLAEMGITAKKLTASARDSQTGQLSLTFDEATDVEAGVPYLIRIKNDIVDPVFEDMPIDGTITNVETDFVDFIPLTDWIVFSTGDKAVLLAGDGDLIAHPGSILSGLATGAYFKLKGAAVGASDVRLIFPDETLPAVTFDAYADNTELFEQYKNQFVNARLTGRTYQARQKEDGTWQAYAYSVCLPFDMSVVDNENVEVYQLHYIKPNDDDNDEFVFIRKAPYMFAGNAYLLVVRKDAIELKADNVLLASEPAGDIDVVSWYNDKGRWGGWHGTLAKIEHSDAARLNAFIMQKDGTFKHIGENDNAWVGAFVSTFIPEGEMRYYKQSYKIKLGEVFPGGGPEEDYVTDFPDAVFYTECDIDEATGIISTTDFTDYTDKSDAWYTIDGRKLQGKPQAKGIYMRHGKKVIMK